MRLETPHGSGRGIDWLSSREEASCAREASPRRHGDSGREEGCGDRRKEGHHEVQAERKAGRYQRGWWSALVAGSLTVSERDPSAGAGASDRRGLRRHREGMSELHEIHSY